MTNLVFDFDAPAVRLHPFPVRADTSLSDERKAELAWMQLPGIARWKNKTLEVMIHPEKLMRGMAANRGVPHSSNLIGIRFKPIRKGGVRRFKATTLLFDFTEREARADDITWVCGRSWEGGGDTTSSEKSLLNWIHGKCSFCYDGHGFPNLFETQFGETFH